MANNLEAKWELADRAGLAKRFSRLGWVGFWVQLALLAIPTALLIYVLFVASAELIILAFGLWLLFGVTRPSSETAEDT